MNIIGRELKKKRNELRLSQKEMAALCEEQGWPLSRGTLAKIESGLRKVSDVEIFFFAEVLNCLADEFLTPEHKRNLKRYL